MTVKAGTPLETIQKAADEAGFFFPLDLGSRGSCAIGGNLSTNAGGNRVIRYGMTRELVLGLEVVLPDGTIITNLNKLMKNNARPEASLHRLGGHARHHHPGGAAAVSKTALDHGRAMCAERLCRGDRPAGCR